jgi:stress-induced morphogen
MTSTTVIDLDTEQAFFVGLEEYTEVKVEVEWEIENNSFDHEFGTEKQYDFVIHSCEFKGVKLVLNDKQFDSIRYELTGK